MLALLIANEPAPRGMPIAACASRHADRGPRRAVSGSRNQARLRAFPPQAVQASPFRAGRRLVPIPVLLFSRDPVSRGFAISRTMQETDGRRRRITPFQGLSIYSPMQVGRVDLGRPRFYLNLGSRFFRTPMTQPIRKMQYRTDNACRRAGTGHPSHIAVARISIRLSIENELRAFAAEFGLRRSWCTVPPQKVDRKPILKSAGLGFEKRSRGGRLALTCKTRLEPIRLACRLYSLHICRLYSLLSWSRIRFIMNGGRRSWRPVGLGRA